MLIDSAYAQEAGVNAMGSGLIQMVPFIAIFAVMYFFMIRPQTKRAKEHKEMVDQLKRGDRIVTSGGLIGTISRVENDAELLVEFSPGVDVRVVRSSIAQVVSKTSSVLTDSSSSENTTSAKVTPLKKKPTPKKK